MSGTARRRREIVAGLLLIGLVVTASLLWRALRRAPAAQHEPQQAGSVGPAGAPQRGAQPASRPAVRSLALQPPAGEPRPPKARPGTEPDPFESASGEAPPIRALLAVGELQLGVRNDSRIKDEPALRKLLSRVGEELERMPRGASRSRPDYQAALETYRGELGRHMYGEVQVRGKDWVAGVEVGTPAVIEGKPVEKRRPE